MQTRSRVRGASERDMDAQPGEENGVGDGEGEAAAFGVLDVLLLVGLVAVVVTLAVRYRRRKNAQKYVRKLSINPA